MSANSLFDPVIDGGVRNPNWFEGRLLTAQSMRERDLAERQRDQLLGRAIGSGVVEGLWVTRGAAGTDGTVRTLSITKGCAITPGGDTLLLGRDITVDVVPPANNAPVGPALFARCQDPPAIATMPSGFGIYVLVMSSATGYRERAPKSGLGTEGVVTGCGDAFVVEGARFRLEKLEPQNISVIDAAGRNELTALIANSTNPACRSLLRNLVAHHCFGAAELAKSLVDPFSASTGMSDLREPGALGDLRRLERMTCCDVPIAVLLWNINGVDALDVWSARRPPALRPHGADPLQRNTQTAYGVARLRQLQFDAQLRDLLVSLPNPPALEARRHFRYLPAAWVLPLAAGQIHGISLEAFFRDLTVRNPVSPPAWPGSGPEFMEGARLPGLLLDSLAFPPLDLRSPEFIWLYRIRENLQSAAATSVLVYAGGQLPWRGAARFDAAYFDHANYASCLLGPGGA